MLSHVSFISGVHVSFAVHGSTSAKSPPPPLVSSLSLPVGPVESSDAPLDVAALLLEPLPPLELAPLPPLELAPLPPLLDAPEPPLLLAPEPPLDVPEPPLEPLPPLLVAWELVLPVVPLEDEELDVAELDDEVDDAAVLDEVSPEVDAGGVPLDSSLLHPSRMNRGAKIEVVNEGTLLKRRVLIKLRLRVLRLISYLRHQTNRSGDQTLAHHSRVARFELGAPQFLARLHKIFPSQTFFRCASFQADAKGVRSATLARKKVGGSRITPAGAGPNPNRYSLSFRSRARAGCDTWPTLLGC